MAINWTDYTHLPSQGIPDYVGAFTKPFNEQQAIKEEKRRALITEALKQAQEEREQEMHGHDVLSKELKNKAATFEVEHMPEDYARQRLIDSLKAEGLDLNNQETRQKIEQMPEEHRAKLSQYLAQRMLIESRRDSLMNGGESLEFGNEEEGFEQHVPFSRLSKPEQFDVSKRMRNDLRAAEDVHKADRTLDEMANIMEEYPELSNSLSNIFIDPRNSSAISKFTRSRMNQQERAALEKFTKLSNDLVLQAGTALGSKNFTDAKLRVLETAKPTSLNTQEANLFLINKMKEEFAPWSSYANDLKKGLKNRYVVEFDLNQYRPQEEVAIPAPLSRKFKVTNHETGEEEYISEEEARREGLI